MMNWQEQELATCSRQTIPRCHGSRDLSQGWFSGECIRIEIRQADSRLANSPRKQSLSTGAHSGNY
jgi:hypothetical protein